MERFIVVGFPRSGTTFACNWINHHPNCFCCDELFSYVENVRAFAARQLTRPYNAYSDTNQSEDAGTYLDRHLWTPKFFLSGSTTGFKLQYDQIKQSSILDHLLGIDNLKIIHIIRDNTLACLASGAIAQQTGVWHRTTSTQQQLSELKSHEPMVYIPFEYLIEKACEHDACFREFHSNFQGFIRRGQVFIVDFSMLNEFPLETMQSIYRFLGVNHSYNPLYDENVPDDNIEWKVGSNTLQERVQNFEELRRKVAEKYPIYNRFFDGITR